MITSVFLVLQYLGHVQDLGDKTGQKSTNMSNTKHMDNILVCDLLTIRNKNQVIGILKNRFRIKPLENLVILCQISKNFMSKKDISKLGN